MITSPKSEIRRPESSCDSHAKGRTLVGLLAVIVGVVALVGCGGGSSSSSTTTTTGTPAVTLSASTLTFSSGINVASATQSVTVTNSGTAALTFSSIQITAGGNVFSSASNTCGTGISASASCTIPVIFTPTSATTFTGTLTITDNASNSPQTVTLNGTGNSVSLSTNSLQFSGTASTTLQVTVSNVSTSAAAITSIGITAGSSNFSQTNTCGSSLAANSNCVVSVTYTPPASGTVSGTLAIAAGGATFNVSLSGSLSAPNTAEISVSFGPNGYLGAPSNTTASYYNGVFTTVTVCLPSNTANCATIPNVLVDTGSVGLRLLSSGAIGATTQVSSLNLPQVTDPVSGYPVYECVQYGDLSYTWGPVQTATVQVGGEIASQLPASAGGTAGIPIQVIAAGVTAPTTVGAYGYTGSTTNPCLTTYTGALTGGLDDDTVANLGANGILGIGNETNDCNLVGTNYCNGALLVSTSEGEELGVTGQYMVYQSSTGDYFIQSLTTQYQVWNPVSAFPTDNNGVSISLPSVPAAGQATDTGTLYFGIGTGTQSNNALSSQTVYARDADGNFNSATLSGVTYTSSNSGGSFIDSGSNALYVSDATTLGISDCYVSSVGVSGETDIGYYCPSSAPFNFSLGLTGSNSTSTTVSLSIGNALNLFSANTSYAAFSNLGGDSGTEPSTDYFDLGLPFFYGRPIYVGISGTSPVPGGTTYPNGYWAF